MTFKVFLYGFTEVIWLPICTLIALIFIFLKCFELLQNFKKLLPSKPNLLSSLPVEIFDRVLASILGFNLIPIDVTRLSFFDILLINLASLSDSILINKNL